MILLREERAELQEPENIDGIQPQVMTREIKHR